MCCRCMDMARMDGGGVGAGRAGVSGAGRKGCGSARVLDKLITGCRCSD